MPDAPMSTKQTAARFANALRSFSASGDAFRVLSTVPPRTETPPPPPPPDSLIVLDSSFNPPTRAHAAMASSAVRWAGPRARLVLLLAVTNADKALVPAPLAVRLGMMEALARELVRGRAPLQVDVAVTTRPYFHDKAAAIEGAGRYGRAEQVFLCGFDTVVRIFEPRYYEGVAGMGSALRPFFRRARLRVTMRPDDAWGTAEEQAAYVAGLEGTLGRSGGDAAWVRRIELVDGVEGAVSSSRVRELVRTGERGAAVEGLVGAEVARWIDEEGLYRE
ncbi:Rossmann-like alpha/beta/alpha sandwich fold protein [Metarhizium guizhouense ARSEF 977]|uniref:Rossmann-like alpha/beta/alpha sandwich fold protein n=1 Tax=Metarhizium guizhouense (strain ARSEF 977) TaxID=1276136 RepID=A0A0B4GKD2_METGA|nr:Rossmann-like alpha/beta/alpha sandwich fold protein [Metarhizium guizhouense ARSEF 977]